MEKYRDRDMVLDELLKAEPKDYRAVYRKFTNNFLNVSADFDQFLYMCIHARRAKRIVEFSTSFGISTIHLSGALRDGRGMKSRTGNTGAGGRGSGPRSFLGS